MLHEAGEDAVNSGWNQRRSNHKLFRNYIGGRWRSSVSVTVIMLFMYYMYLGIRAGLAEHALILSTR